LKSKARSIIFWCKKLFPSRTPGVLPKSLYGNQLITTAAAMRYLHGIPMGRVCEQTQMGPGSLVEIFHRLAGLFEPIPAPLIEQYRQAPVKHADETSSRTEGTMMSRWPGFSVSDAIQDGLLGV
jgi:transposase